MKANLAKLEMVSGLARITWFSPAMPTSDMLASAGSPIALSSTDYNIALAARYLTGAFSQGIDFFRG
jgi:hypothetical protein